MCSPPCAYESICRKLSHADTALSLLVGCCSISNFPPLFDCFPGSLNSEELLEATSNLEEEDVDDSLFFEGVIWGPIQI